MANSVTPIINGKGIYKLPPKMPVFPEPNPDFIVHGGNIGKRVGQGLSYRVRVIDGDSESTDKGYRRRGMIYHLHRFEGRSNRTRLHLEPPVADNEVHFIDSSLRHKIHLQPAEAPPDITYKDGQLSTPLVEGAYYIVVSGINILGIDVFKDFNDSDFVFGSARLSTDHYPNGLGFIPVDVGHTWAGIDGIGLVQYTNNSQSQNSKGLPVGL